MATRNYTRHDMSSTVNDAAIDPVFQLQQTAFDVSSASSEAVATPVVLPVSSAVGEQEVGIHEADDGHDGGPLSCAHGPPVLGEAASSAASPSAAGLKQPAIPADVDTSTADLTYRRNRRDFSANNPSPDGWLYPHKKGIGTGSNLEAFKDDIEARTQRGENCKTIADALNAMGVQTSDRAVSRVRIKWGMRRRAQRKQKTPPPDSEAARLSAKSKVQALRKMEITRMTREGLTAEEIYGNLTSRGMELKKGVATVLRLQSAWKLTHDEKRWVENFRHQRHKQARAQQLQAFRDIARELDVEDVDAWLAAKMKEDAARRARHELALKLMGEHAPKNPERRRLQRSRTKSGTGKGQAQPEDDASASDSDAGPGYESEYPGPGADDGFAPLKGQTDIDMNDDEELQGGEGAVGVPERVFARMDNKTVPQSYGAPGLPPGSSPPMQSRTVALLDPRLSVPSTYLPTGTLASQDASSERPVEDTPQSQPTTEPVPIPAIGSLSAPDLTTQNDSQYFGPPFDTTSPRPRSSPPKAPKSGPALATAAAPVTPSPTLVLRPGEVEANKTALSTLDQYTAAAQAYKMMLQARNTNKPLAGSLTGLPPSSKEVDAAKRTLKEVTQAMMMSLE